MEEGGARKVGKEEVSYLGIGSFLGKITHRKVFRSIE